MRLLGFAATLQRVQSSLTCTWDSGMAMHVHFDFAPTVLQGYLSML